MNPFEAFRSYSAAQRELPLDRILARRDVVLQRLLQGYQALVEEESKQLIWVVEQGALSRAYTTAVEALQGVDFTVEDLEDMCLELDANDGVNTPMGAPSGLFIAAMCNHYQPMTLRSICTSSAGAGRFWGIVCRVGGACTWMAMREILSAPCSRVATWW
jgi:hypothetical protein